jgi:hypothetical protein
MITEMIVGAGFAIRSTLRIGWSEPVARPGSPFADFVSCDDIQYGSCFPTNNGQDLFSNSHPSSIMAPEWKIIDFNPIDVRILAKCSLVELQMI